MSEPKRKDAIAGEIVHEYDGIEEADNALPTWWVAVFILTIVFSAAYWVMVERLHLLPTPAEALLIAETQRAQQSGGVDDQVLLAAADDASRVGSGQRLFATHCVACHGSKAEGNIGPNLTDTTWLHGGAPASIFATIRDGVPAKGMPAWGPLLGADNLKAISAFVVHVRNSQVPGKPPQGEPYSGI